jgi:GTPase SAR1 family protein
MSYLRGASGYLLVADGTRRTTLDTALALHEAADRTIGHVPFVLVLNKADLSAQWELDEGAIVRLMQSGWRVLRTSAKTGIGVEEAFTTLGNAMLSE